MCKNREITILLILQDWWNVTNYASFYRTWNIIVHDWLYEYIYTVSAYQ